MNKRQSRFLFEILLNLLSELHFRLCFRYFTLGATYKITRKSILAIEEIVFVNLDEQGNAHPSPEK
jgi:hypothetical protein